MTGRLHLQLIALATVLVVLSGCATSGRRVTSGAAASSTTGPPPQTGPAPDTGAGAARPSIRSLWFVDRRRGFVTTGTGISATSDGGQTWVKVLALPTIHRVTFVDPAHGWAVADHDLLRTSDGGRSWQAVGEGPTALTAVDFVSPDEGWGTASDSSVVATRDGGGHWAVQPTPGPVGTVCFSDRAHGWAGSPGRVMATGDGGRHWSFVYRLPSLVEPDLVPDVQCRGGSVWAMFRGQGAASKQDYTLVRHSLGTTRWTVLAHGWGFAPEPQLRGAPAVPGIGDYAGPFAALSSRVAALIGQCVACGPTRIGVVVADTTRPWSGGWIAALDGAEAIEGVQPTFVDRLHGWVAAERLEGGPVIAATADGGRTWHLLPNPPS